MKSLATFLLTCTAVVTFAGAGNAARERDRSVAAAERSSSAVRTDTAAGRLRVLFAGDWSGRPQIYVADPARPATQRQVTFGGDGFVEPSPSPDGRRLAYQASPSFPFSFQARDLWLARANGTAAKRVAEGFVANVTWSSDSRRLAYRLDGKWHVIQADGANDRVIESPPAWLRPPEVSPDGKWRVTPLLRTGVTIGFAVSSVRSEERREFDATSEASWSPNSRYVAYTRADGIYVSNVRTGGVRRLTREVGIELAWSPDSASLAFVEGVRENRSATWVSATGDLRTVTLAGRARTIVDSDRAYGGSMASIAWVKSAATTRYRTPESAPTTRIAPLGLLAGGRIARLAADGSRVAFVSCEGVFVWTPATGVVTTLIRSEPLSVCRMRDRYWVGYSLAVAGDRVAYGVLQGCNTIDVTLRLEVLAPTRTSSELARGRGSCASPYAPGAGWLAGSGDLLAFSTWDEACAAPPGCSPTSYRTTNQRVHRTPQAGCPCPVIVSSPGALIPADVDSGRIVAYGNNETLILDVDGNPLRSFPVSPLAAQLSGVDLALVLRGGVRHFDAKTGALLHTWPLPDVPTGARCEHRCAPTGGEPRLIVEDLARGLLAYVLDGRVRVLRLTDGVDRVVAAGTQARFMDAGLVYADGSRLHVVPFGRLPLR